MTRAAAWCCLALSLAPRPAVAQAGDFALPPNSVLPNYDRVSVGHREGLEANAFVARTDDAGANWYNPAGLALSEKSALNASANAYEFNRVSLEGTEFTKGGTRFSSIGSFFGGVIGAPILHSSNLRLGFSFTKPVSWAPSEIEGEFTNTTAAGDESFIYSTTAAMATEIPALNAGLRLGKRVRVGAGVGYAHTSLRQNQSISDRLLSAASATTALRSIETDGSTGGLLLTGGVQVDLGSKIRAGATLTAPSLRLSGSSRITYQNTLFSGTGSRDLAFRDGEAKLDYQIPLRATVGVSAQLGRGEVEVDLRYHGSRAAYALYSSTVPATLVSTDAAGVPTVATLAFADVIEETQAVSNVAIGGHYAFSPGFRAHVGFFTDNSPVGDPGTSLFRSIDLVGFSGGVSFGAGRLTASTGVSGSSGTSDERQIGPSLGGISGVTRFKVRTFNFLYAISYSF